MTKRNKKTTQTIHEDVMRLALEGDAEMQFRLASYYDSQGKLAKDSLAVYWYTKAAEQGHAGAQYKLAIHLAGSFWSGSEPEITVAFDLVTKSAEQGHPEAQSELGECYNQGYVVDENAILAVEWWKKAAENGNVEILTVLGEWFEEESCRGIEQNIPLAIEYYRQAASHGNTYAQEALERLMKQESTNE